MSVHFEEQNRGIYPKRGQLPPLNQESQPYRKDYDGGSGIDYQKVPQSQILDSKYKNEQQSVFQEEEPQRAQDQLLAHRSHVSSMNHATYLSDEHFRSCYPIGLKITNFLYQTLSCKNRKETFVDHLHQLDKMHPQASQLKEEQPKLLNKVIAKLQSKNISIKILGTSSLELDTNIMHPFVRIHIINMTTGSYIEKSNVLDNVVYNFESNCNIEIKDGIKERKSCELEFIPAFATNCCDLRLTGGSRAIWNEEILLNETAEHLYNSEVVILFEILDFHPMYLNAKKVDSLDADYFYKVAWGYMRPLGLAKMHMGTIKLQLYRYVFQTRLLNQNDRKECTPLVYFDFIWPQKVYTNFQKKQEYSGVLNILYLVHPKPPQKNVYERSISVYETEKGDRDVKKKFQSTIEQKSEDEIQEELSDLDKQNLRRRRFAGEKSQIPDKIVFKFASAPLGFDKGFNRKGNYLAAACTYKSSKTIIKIFDVEQGILFAELKGHSNIVHDIKFSQQSTFLITVSSDQTAKVWKMPKHSGETVQQDESDHYLVAQLAHPSYVYAGIFLSDGSTPLIATACFDSRIRIWKIDSRRTLVVQQDPEQQEVISSTGNTFDNFDDLLDHRHPNSLVYDGSKRMYVGDSLGAIHVFDINSTINSQHIASRINYILHPEMAGDAINCLTLVPPESKDLLIHSRDNCLRVLEVNSSEGKYTDGNLTTGSIAGRFFGTVTQKLSIRSTLSPCGEFVLSGSEDGKPHLWDNVSITQPTNQFQYSLIGAVTDVAWNENYHMIALAGFGDEHPIVVYIWQRNEEMNIMEYKELQEKLITQQKKKHAEAEEIQYQNAPGNQNYNRNGHQEYSQKQGPFGGAQIDFTSLNPNQSQPFQTGPFQNKDSGQIGNKPF